MSVSKLAPWALTFVASAALTGCLGSITLAPHLSREAELAPPAAAGRHSTVLQRAAAFEKQNDKSKDVHWYRAWRAAAMVGLGQFAQAEALLEQVLADISLAKVSPSQPERLRMFILDLQAASARGQRQPARALERLDQAFTLAQRVELESDGACDRDLVLAGRARQIEVVAEAAGNIPRAGKAHATLTARMDAWVKCKRLEDYLALGPLPQVAAAATARAAGPNAVVPPTNAPMPPPVALPRADPPPAAPPPPAPVAPPARPKGPAGLPVASARYAPVNPGPWKEGLEAAAPLLAKRAPGSKTDIWIRTDGAHHALRVQLARPARRLEDLLPVFRSAVVFFERTRAVKPSADRVMVVTGKVTVLADKAAIMDLFLERVDAQGFLSRLRRLP